MDPIILNLSLYRSSNKTVENVAKEIGWTVTKVSEKVDNTYTIIWLHRTSYASRIKTLQSYQRINRFPYSFVFGNKSNFAKIFEGKRSLLQDDFNFYPKTFLLPNEFSEFKTYASSHDETFIIKPNDGSCGEGIILTKDVKEVEKYNDSIVQTYISNPLKIEGKKFDLRVYCLIMSVDPLIVYVYKEGIVRICTEEYQPPSEENFSKGYMHLTNYALNKQNKEKFSEVIAGNYFVGNKRSFKFFRHWLENEMKVNSDEVFGKIEDVVLKSIMAFTPFLREKYRMCMKGENKGGSFTCFELLGVDVMFDEDYNPWLMEINCSPSLSRDTPFDEDLKIGLIKETLFLVGINPKRRANTLIRNVLMKLKYDGANISKEMMEMVKQPDRKEDFENMQKAEEKYLNMYKKVYPTEENEKRFEHIIKKFDI